jgi:hypothetical protein
MNELEKLLYRKKSTEKLLEIWSKGIKIYTEFTDTCEAALKDESREDRNEIRVKLHEARIPLNHYITSFKLARREYDHHIIPEIEKVASKEEQMSIDFKDLEAKANELAQNEIFAKHDKQPDNVELIQVNESLKQHIQLLKSLIAECAGKAVTTEDNYEKAKLNLDVFKWQLQLITNEKRLEEREDYYNNQFKPVYDKEMKEADQYLDALIERANEIVKLGIDVKLTFLLQEYEKNKEDKEKVWLFYTTLKSRLKKIGKEMRKNKSQFKGNMHLAKTIVE